MIPCTLTMQAGAANLTTILANPSFAPGPGRRTTIVSYAAAPGPGIAFQALQLPLFASVNTADSLAAENLMHSHCILIGS